MASFYASAGDPDEMLKQKRRHRFVEIAAQLMVFLSFAIAIFFHYPSKSIAAEKARSYRLADATWVFGGTDDTISKWTEEQALSVTQKLCGQSARTSRDLTGPFCIVVGTPENNRFVEKAVQEGLLDLAGLAQDDYYLKQTALGDKPVLLIAGANPRAAMYGVFDLFERLGCRFLISRDVIPTADPDLAMPRLDILRHTDNTWRGLGFQYCFATNSMMSLPDYQAMFDQMAKMRMNRMGFFHFDNEPFTDFSLGRSISSNSDRSRP